MSVEECTEGIVRVAEQTQSLDPRQQASFEWEMSAGLNADISHNCTGTYVHSQVMPLATVYNHTILQWYFLIKMVVYWTQNLYISKLWTIVSTVPMDSAIVL